MKILIKNNKITIKHKINKQKDIIVLIVTILIIIIITIQIIQMKKHNLK